MSEEKQPDKTDKIIGAVCLVIGIVLVLITLGSSGLITNSIITIIHVWKGQVVVSELKLPLLYLLILTGITIGAYQLLKYSGKTLFKGHDDIR